MTGEFDLHGVLVPPLLVWLLLALPLTAAVRRVLGWLGFYRFVWHRALFDFALYAVVVGALALI